MCIRDRSSDTVKSGIILGLGTRLQVLQNKAVQRITSQSDIDLVAPAKRKCVYYIILSDQDATMSFLSSLFFSCMFIKLSRFADVQPGGRCPVPVNLILDEFNNVGRIGGAEDGSDFARSLSVVRSRDIRVMLAVQSLGQLQNRYPVSYTHLDVYKRQVLTTNELKELRLPADEADNKLFRIISTHQGSPDGKVYPDECRYDKSRHIASARYPAYVRAQSMPHLHGQKAIWT